MRENTVRENIVRGRGNMVIEKMCERDRETILIFHLIVSALEHHRCGKPVIVKCMCSDA